MKRLKNLHGVTTNNYQVVRRERNPNSCRLSYEWLCLCSCGNYFYDNSCRIASGKRISCGCHLSEKRHLDRKLYSIWASMIQRCTNPKNANYHRYGGRGITVCDRWMRFDEFYDDVHPRPSTAHSLDRKDNNADYSPENYRWATHLEQANNKRGNINVSFMGVTKTIADWGRKFGVKSPHYLCKKLGPENWVKAAWQAAARKEAP